ncbi:MAG: hypothetical protein GY729_19590 [Desulfobacteraceae bacterium]|nr:hypothetical protein [Desulfobacteraceae bacterium]
MEPNLFRKSRESINALCENIDSLIQDKAVDEAKKIFRRVTSKLENLRPHAEGIIQNRSVENLTFKLKYLSSQILKIKPLKKKKKAKSKVKKIPDLIWDKEKINTLKNTFLKKALLNMNDDTDSVIRFGTSGKGIRPNYQITFSNDETFVFSGSSHKTVKREPSFDNKKVSDPFDYKLIETIAGEKENS